MTESGGDSSAGRPGASMMTTGTDADLRLLIEAMQTHAVSMLDPTGVLCSWNSGAERIFGYTAAEAMGRHLSSFYLGEDQALGEPARALRAARRYGKFETETWQIGKSNRRFFAHLVLYPVRGGSGELTGYASVIRDTQEYKPAYLLSDKNAAAILQRQKLQSMAQFTRSMVHDFNNLLTVVSNNLDRLLTGPDDPARFRRLVEGARRAAQRGTLLMSHLNVFAGRQPADPRPLDVNEIISDLEAELRLACGETIALSLTLDPGLPLALLDQLQCETAVLNLVTNARDAMPRGGRLGIRTECEKRDGEGTEAGLRIVVEDTGSGMAPEVRARAFEPFFTTKEAGTGTGLGLSQVYGFAVQAGGHVEIESAVGEGTRVMVSLPALSEEDGAES
ncbi:MAG TPA: ATP-binding protein [Stellaceae bacterium]|nr:ATP-binding protein [Stellaceae bacterium]